MHSRSQLFISFHNQEKSDCQNTVSHDYDTFTIAAIAVLAILLLVGFGYTQSTQSSQYIYCHCQREYVNKKKHSILFFMKRNQTQIIHSFLNLML